MVTTRQGVRAQSTEAGEAGLSVDRYFTAEGIHPYDEFEWELRDAVISDPRTGQVAFEQRDVEFPASWSMNATTITAQKYFRGQLGSARRERSVREMIDRVADTITRWGQRDGYFADEASATVFNEELKHLLVAQKAAFNSPVWFNVGVEGRSPQCSACFILSVEDTMSSILNWYYEEGVIFKGGSGAGVNLSHIRSSSELLYGGGTASGPVSFMRGADASAGTIKSGGTTRRAAKMVILDVDHPDVEEFIWCKHREEVKAKALREAGFDMELDGLDSASVQYQNANNSVRVTDEFMQAVAGDTDFALRSVTTGETEKTVSARDLMRQMSQAAWECADPGVQYDTTINDWHTTPNAGRINGSNPCCFTGDTLVATAEGQVSLEVLEKTARAGQELPDALTYDPVTGAPVIEPIVDAWVAGLAEVLYEVCTVGGLSLRCTPEHRFLTETGGYVQAQELGRGDGLRAVAPEGAERTVVVRDEVKSVRQLPLDEPVTVYDAEVAEVHSFAAANDSAVVGRGHSLVVHNSEYMHLDNSACNLASLNLRKFEAEGVFDVESFQRAVETVFTAQEIIVGNSSYPTDAIAANAKAYRQLGLGYANLGGLLMSQGIAYESAEGRAWAGALTALMTGHAYRTSAEIAKVTGPFDGYADDRDGMLRVLRKHQAAVDDIDADAAPANVVEGARQSWADACELGAEHGVRNAQASVLAPTGTISLLMDCDTTGIEPDLGLVKTKKLVGGGTMRIINRTVPEALSRLGYQPEQIEAITDYIDEHATIQGSPAVREEHLPVFDCAMGERAISPMGHVSMMGAVQPFISGSISKCVTGETLLSTADGLVRADSLYRGEAPDSFRDEAIEVASLGGPCKTDAFYYGGVRPVRRVTLRSGQTVSGTPNHRVLVGSDNGLAWRRLDELEPGEAVAQQYGENLWSQVPTDFADFTPTPSYGDQTPVSVPREMSAELAFLLGAYTAEGHVTSSNWTVTISNTDEEVIARVQAAWQELFGLTARVEREPARCPEVIVSSKTVVEFLDYLGCGHRANTKRIPGAVLRSPKRMVVEFLNGLFLDAYVYTGHSSAKVGLCVDSPRLLDDYQALLTNLGVVHSRTEKANPDYGKSYGEVYAAGDEAAELATIAEFAEPAKSARADELRLGGYDSSKADVVPGIDGPALYELIPKGSGGRDGRRSLRREFTFLRDPRTHQVSRRTLERVAELPGVVLPDWLQQVLDDNLHFSPVVSVEDAGEQEVYDVSVPETHAFVANGIVNHNTVNMPESATVEQVEEMYREGWRLGLKSLAIYRDNCKVAQPLSVASKSETGGQATTSEAEQHGMIRRRLPKQRPSQTISFGLGEAEGYLTAGEYPGDGLGEIFVKLGKQGSTLSGVMDAFAISVSLGLQYGVPLEAYAKKFTNMRFEPAGMTDDPEVRFTSSIVDYIFRRLAIEYLPIETRQELGIYTIEERQSSLESGQPQVGPAAPVSETEEPSASQAPIEDLYGDAPMCYGCGVQMVRAGSCHVCQSCGSTSGCS
jgi:ribonucleotide reductase alpha subunit